MEQIGQYQIITKIQELKSGINYWRCENTEGGEFEVLTIKGSTETNKTLGRVLLNEVKPLYCREISGFQKVVESGFDAANNVTYIVYEYIDGKLLIDNPSNTSLLSIKSIVSGLAELKKENRQNFIITPEYITVDERGNGKLRFVGLFDYFRAEGLLNTDYLSPNVVDWLNDSRNPKPNFQDDIYSLVKSFEGFLADTYKKEAVLTIIELFNKSICEKRIERYSKYYEFIEALDRLPDLQKRIQTVVVQTIRVKTQPEFEGEFQNVVNSMNTSVWFSIYDKVSIEKSQITGLFSTNDWSGRFFVDEGGYLFIPFKSCRREKNESLIKDINSFLSDHKFSLLDSNINCVPFFKSKFQEINKLGELNKTKNESVRIWKTLPEKEREFIIERAFKADYQKRDSVKNSNNIEFTLTEVSKVNWVRLKELKNKNTVLFIDEQRIGTILDFDQKNAVIKIKDPFCSIDEIPEKGELIEDTRQQTGQFKKQVEACEKFNKSDVVNPALCAILATPETATIQNSAHLFSYEYDNFKEELFNAKIKNDNTQIESVFEALHHKPVFLIQGPPGTGKTTVIVELIRQLIKRQKDVKILITSQSNKAVDNVIKHLDSINQKENEDLKFIRLASENTLENEKISQLVLPHTFENKLANWISETQKKSNDFLRKRFPNHEKQRPLVDFFDFYSTIDKGSGLKEFKDRLRISSGYLKKLFGDPSSLDEVNRIFENALGREYMKMRDLQREWNVFLDGAMIDDGKDRKKSMLNNGSTEIDFLSAMMMTTNVIGSTCIHIASSNYSRVNFRFDYVIMDESSKACPAETLVPINMGQNIILIGDHKQLPPIVTREEAVKRKVKDELEDDGLPFEKKFSESLFEKLVKSFESDDSKKNFIKMLDIQYRMPRQIGALISKYFYDGKLNNPSLTALPDYDNSKSHQLKLTKETSIVFLSTSLRKNPNDNDNKYNRQNRCNVEVIKEILEKLNALYPQNLTIDEPFNVGVIAGYRGQVELLKQEIRPGKYHNFVKVEVTDDGKKKRINLIEINTVDEFQGSERDIIIYDIVRSSQGQSSIGFLDDYRRINVAFSRAKRLLIIVGDADYLVNRARLNPNGQFNEFKLQQIASDLQEQGLIFNELNDIFK